MGPPDSGPAWQGLASCFSRSESPGLPSAVLGGCRDHPDPKIPPGLGKGRAGEGPRRSPAPAALTDSATAAMTGAGRPRPRALIGRGAPHPQPEGPRGGSALAQPLAFGVSGPAPSSRPLWPKHAVLQTEDPLCLLLFRQGPAFAKPINAAWLLL